MKKALETRGRKRKGPENSGPGVKTRFGSLCGTPPNYFFFLGAAFFFAFLVAFFID